MRFFFKIGLILLLLYTSTINNILGQNPYFREIINSNNIDGAQINCFIQDDKGFLWIGTTNGVFQFDGVTYTKIPTSDSIGTSNVTSIFNDQNGIIWLGYENGNIATFNQIQPHSLAPKGNKPQTKITAILQSTDSSIIIGTYGEGVFVLKNNTYNQINADSGLSDDFIYSVIIDDLGKIWVGNDNGINVIELKDNETVIKTLSVEDGLPDFIIKDLAFGSNGLIWIGTHDRGICNYDPSQNLFMIPNKLENWTFGPVNDMLIMKDRIWVATEKNGVIDYSTSTYKLRNYKQSNNIDLNRATKLLYDQEGNILISTNKNISLSFGSKLEQLHQINDINIEDIHALTIDAEDNVWFANDKGVFKFNPNNIGEETMLNTYPISFDIGEQKIMSLYQDPYGFLWIGTFGKGIIRLNPENNQQTIITESDGLINGNVLSIQGSENEIWFATLGGASKVEITSNLSDIRYIPTFDNYQEQQGLSNSFIYHIYIDPQNRVWFATDGSGISFYKNGKIYPVDDELFNNKVIYSLAGDNLGNIWVNIAHEGLYKYDGKKAIKVLKDPDHINLSFSGLKANTSNELVMAYNEGIDILNITSDDIIHYEGNAGLSNCNPDLNTIDSDSKGNIWIGTALGLVKYTGSSKSSLNKPVSRINQVAVYLEQIDKQQTSFSYNKNHFSFKYSGLWFQYPEKVDFLIQLAGHDLDWIKTKNNSVIYSNLKPGAYTFKVKSALYNNFDKASVATYTFTINKPFWTTYWFFIILIIVLGLSLYSFIKYRENRINQQQRILQEKIKFQFENLKSQINPHFLFNSFSTLIALIESNESAAVEYVEELSELFRNILEFKDQDVVSIKEEMGIIDNYYKLQKRRYGDNLNLAINDKIAEANFNIPPMTIQMLIENALKHNIISTDKPLHIDIYLNNEQSTIYIENNLQEKQENIDSTGIGIQNIINRYKILTEKEIEIYKTDYIYRVGLPVIK